MHHYQTLGRDHHSHQITLCIHSPGVVMSGLMCLMSLQNFKTNPKTGIFYQSRKSHLPNRAKFSRIDQHSIVVMYVGVSLWCGR